MALTIRDTNSVTAGTNTTLSTAGDDFYLLQGVLLASTEGNAINVNANEVNLQIDGTVAAFARPISSNSGSLQLVVGATGTVTGMTSDSADGAVVFQGGNVDVTNYGAITAPEAIALFMDSSNNEVRNLGTISGTTGLQFSFGTGDSVYNAGLISGSGSFDGVRDVYEGTGILVQSSNTKVVNAAGGRIVTTALDAPAITGNSFAGGLVIENYGEISALAGSGVNLSTVFGGEAESQIFNWGTIQGRLGSVIGSINADSVVNAGTLSGGVQLNGGDDSFDNSIGTITGRVDGGAGDDQLTGGTDAERMMGGTGNDVIDLGGGNDVFLAGNTEWAGSDNNDDIDGGDGIDTYDARNMLSSVTIRLNEQRAVGTEIGQDVVIAFENAFGGFGNDVLAGESGRNVLRGNHGNDILNGLEGNDRIFGGNGIDTIVGNLGRDVMTGGADADIFDFNATADSATGDSTRDLITDFVTGLDDIDLSTIDANTTLGGNQAFTFIGSAAFGNVAGQLRFAPGGAQFTLVEGDVNGDGKADFQIGLMGTIVLVAGDFVL